MPRMQIAFPSPNRLAWLLLLAGAAAAQAQQEPRALQPLNMQTIAGALERAVGEPMRAARTSGRIDLKGKRFYIAEYQLLFDQSGEVVASPADGRLFGNQIEGDQAVVAYTAQHDVAALQALTDRAWADLGARLKAAGITPAPADEITFTQGAVYEASGHATRPGSPVVVESRAGDNTRRYLAFAPSGMKIVPRGIAGMGLGNLAARVAYPSKGIEGLSMLMAVNFTGFDAAGGKKRASTFEGANELRAESPMLEIVPAPSAALVNAHAQLSLVNLTEPIVLVGEFARLRPGPRTGVLAPDSPLDLLRSFGRLIGAVPGAPAGKRLDAVLEVDGPTTARFALFGISAVNQAIVDALKAAQE